MRHTRVFKTIGLAVFVLFIGSAVAGGILLDRLVFAELVSSNARPVMSEPDYKLIAEAWRVISKEYVERKDVQSRKLTYGAVTGMVNALGDTGHSAFLSPDMVELEGHFMEGKFSGIGAQIRMKEGRVIILAPMEDSPAQRAGLQSGDVIMQVDGKDVVGQSIEEVVKRITGTAGTTVTLTILSPKTGQTRQIPLVRARITVHNVTWARMPASGMAVLRIAGFSEGVAGDIRKALTEIRKQGINSIILDLRDNPGGIFEAAVGTASQFLNSGTVALVKSSNGDTKPVPVQHGGVATDVRLVVLINEGTASGAEILAGALQDAHRARLVGEKTFGTGTVLKSFKLSDGSALLLAIAEWLTPNGRVIWHKGISPDVAVSLPAGVDQLYPEKIRGMSEAQLRASGDKQLLQAMDLLLNPGRQVKEETQKL